MKVTFERGDALAGAARLNPPALAHCAAVDQALGGETGERVYSYWPGAVESWEACRTSDLVGLGAFHAWNTEKGGWIYTLASIEGGAVNTERLTEALEALGRHAASIGVRHVAWAAPVLTTAQRAEVRTHLEARGTLVHIHAYE